MPRLAVGLGQHGAENSSGSWSLFQHTQPCAGFAVQEGTREPSAKGLLWSRTHPSSLESAMHVKLKWSEKASAGRHLQRLCSSAPWPCSVCSWRGAGRWGARCVPGAGAPLVVFCVSTTARAADLVLAWGSFQLQRAVYCHSKK